MDAPDRIYQLVEKFDRDQPGTEDEVQQYFVDPLFEALGWNMRDKQQVRHEPSVPVWDEGIERSKRADYSFHIGNTRHFFVETKMPHVNLERNTVPAFQLRRYGWSGGTPVSVLTDFEEFCVYDCRIEPNQIDPATTARLRYWTYEKYIDNWDEIESRFSREAVAQGALREWVEGERVRGILSVDQSFLRKMEDWRDMLAKDIALHNRDLSQRQLNLLVQRTIDRIVFLRIAEDRDIESYRRLRSAADEGKQVYQELKRLFIEADDKYNSGLFHFGADERASEPDRDSLNIHIPDEPLRHTIKNLYFPFSPYEFSVMPPEILGQVYEQFLGKVIELSAGGAVRVEEKPEVRKAGGVYYTPAYIVDYIVENTVGALLKDKSPDEAAKLRILDPACGSGSFLVGAYNYLLDWHLKYYSEHPTEFRNRRRETADGMILTTAEKRRILQNNIYGVDLDQNAVEVSKLSLLLKMLENESDAAGRQTLMFAAGGRILPDLSDNIKWGNSLIGSDFFRGPQATLFADEEEMLKVKAFDWDSEAGFGAIMAAGGFDAVIGNPPWVSLSGKFRNDTLTDDQLRYLIEKFQGNTYMPNMYEYFVAQGLRLLQSGGFYSLIVPDRLGFNGQFIGLRELILKCFKVIKWIYKLPFPGITADTLVFVIRNHTPDNESVMQVAEWSGEPILKKQVTVLNDSTRKIEYFDDLQAHQLTEKLIVNPHVKPLEKITKTTGGFGGKSKLITRERVSDRQISVIKGESIGRYSIHGHLWFEFKKANITGRTTDKKKLGASPKVVMRKTGDRIIATFESTGVFPEQSLYFLYDNQSKLNYKYVLGMLNSQLLNYFFRAKSLTNKRSIAQVKKVDLDQLPIRTIDFDNPADVAMHDKMVELVEEMLDRHRQLPNLTGEGRRIQETLIATVDDEIDALVYKLYGLSEDEVAIVEGG